MAIELVPLTVATFSLRDPIVLPETPSGMRVIAEVDTAKFEGERFSGTLKGVAAADWLTIGPDMTGTLDVRVTIETHDGALVFSSYRGRVDFSKPPGEAPLTTANFGVEKGRQRPLSDAKALGVSRRSLRRWHGRS